MEKILNQILSELKNVNSRIGGLDSRMDSLDSRMDSLESKVENLESQTKENTQILKALQHNSEVHKAEIDNLTYSVSQISGDIKSSKESTVKGEKVYDYLQNFSKIS